MRGELEAEIALRLARSLKVVKKYPHDDYAIQTVADKMAALCPGSDAQSPEEQAEELCNEVMLWPEWTGFYDFHELARRKFGTPIAPSNALQDYGPRPPILCRVCNDTGVVNGPEGHRFCHDCEFGKLSESELGEKWLKLMDGSRKAKKERVELGPMPKPEAIAEHAAAERMLAEQIVENARLLSKDRTIPREMRRAARNIAKRYPAAEEGEGAA